MYAIEVFATMLVLRLIVPLALLLGIGETARRRQLTSFRRMSGGL